jgi:hypothetical protein
VDKEVYKQLVREHPDKFPSNAKVTFFQQATPRIWKKDYDHAGVLGTAVAGILVCHFGGFLIFMLPLVSSSFLMIC